MNNYNVRKVNYGGFLNKCDKRNNTIKIIIASLLDFQNLPSVWNR